MIVVTGYIRIAADQFERARPHMRKVLEATRREPGCILYAYAEDVLEPGVIRIVERWSDWASLDAHGGTPHIADWRAFLNEIGVIDREITAHAAGEARPL